LPSRGEGLSNSLLEAMAMGIPVIASSVSGTPDVIDDGEDGLLIPPDSAASLAAAMSTIIHHPGQAEILGQNARRKVERSFSLQSVAFRYSTLYDGL
jgi:glycosyltransferase involved in cell wall biosynthesis